GDPELPDPQEPAIGRPGNPTNPGAEQDNVVPDLHGIISCRSKGPLSPPRSGLLTRSVHNCELRNSRSPRHCGKYGSGTRFCPRWIILARHLGVNASAAHLFKRPVSYARGGAAALHKLPRFATSFIGRSRQRGGVSRLAGRTRLFMPVGSGGV